MNKNNLIIFNLNALNNDQVTGSDDTDKKIVKFNPVKIDINIYQNIIFYILGD